MPTYEYKCTNDGSTFDIWQEVGSPAPPCPDCGAPTKKVFAPPRVIFKGPGFYVTDKRSEESGSSGKKSADAKSDEAKTTDDKSDTASKTTESKTETKAETPKADAGAKQAD